MSHFSKGVGDVHIHNREVELVTSLIPQQLRENASTLIALLEDYYKYQNLKDNPTNIIDRIEYEHNLDFVDEKYLESLKREIALNIPKSFYVDDRDLLRYIVEFYKIRGSEEGIRLFFLLFFNDTTTIKYPSERLLKPSVGDIDSHGYSKQDGSRVYYNDSVGIYEEDPPVNKSVTLPEYSTNLRGFIKISTDFESVFWTYDTPSVDKNFEIRVLKDREDTSVSSPLPSPNSGFSISTRLNSGDNTLSVDLTDNVAVTETIDVSEIIDSPAAPNTYRLGTIAEDEIIYQQKLEVE